MKKIIKQIIALSFFVFSSSSYSLTDASYKKIKEIFLEQAKKDGEIVVFDIQNHKDITKSEKKEIEKIKLLDNSSSVIAKYILDGKGNNHNSVIRGSDGVTSWVFAKGLEPISFVENKCSYLFYVSTNQDCLNTPLPIKENIEEFLNFHNIYIDKEYFSNFFFIHELAHLIPEQTILPDNIDITRIWIDDVVKQYQEVYSDIFSTIFLHNFLNYPVSKYKEIVSFRDFNLNANDDLKHYSVPYLEKMIKKNDWKELKDFDKIDAYIQNLYREINKEIIISKKRNTFIYKKNFSWCNNLDFTSIKTKEALDIVVYHCKKLKK